MADANLSLAECRYCGHGRYAHFQHDGDDPRCRADNTSGQHAKPCECPEFVDQTL